MFKKVIPLNSQAQAGKKYSTSIGYGFASQQHLTAIALPEFPKASALYPIFFVKKPEADKFFPVMLLGTDPGENLFVNADGTWQAGGYIPVAFRRYPFVLVQGEVQGDYSVWMDDNPVLLDPENGVELFTTEGVETEFMVKTKEFLVQLLQSEMLTEKFCDKIIELDLLVPGSLEIRLGTDVKSFPGAFIIDEKRLNALSETAFATLREHGFLGAIYAHLLSLAQIDAVVARKVAALNAK